MIQALSITRWMAVVIAIGAAGTLCPASAQRVYAKNVSQNAAHAYHIGVWFFTVWNSAADGVQVRNTQKAYGRSDVWGGIRDYAEGHGVAPVDNVTTHAAVDFSDRKPLLGFYDLMQQSTVDAEIKEAASEGIAFFAFYWYLDGQGRETSASAPLGKFFGSKLAGQVKYILAPIINRGPGEPPLTLDVWNTTIVPQILNYMTSHAYDRIDGRPMLIDFRLPFANAIDHAAAYASLRGTIRRRLGVEPLIISLLGAKATAADLQYRQRAIKPDGFTCFNFPIDGKPEQPYPAFASEFLASIKRQTGLDHGERNPSQVYIPCGSIGQDARPWYRIEYGWTPGNGLPGPNSRSYTTRPTPAEFDAYLEQLKSFMDSDDLDTLDTAILYAWNEWGEAAADIEPSKPQGYLYADIVRKVFGLTPHH